MHAQTYTHDAGYHEYLRHTTELNLNLRPDPNLCPNPKSEPVPNFDADPRPDSDPKPPTRILNHTPHPTPQVRLETMKTSRIREVATVNDPERLKLEREREAMKLQKRKNP